MTTYPYTLSDLLSEYIGSDSCLDGTHDYDMGECARLVKDERTDQGLTGYWITMDVESRTVFAGSLIDPPEYDYRVTLTAVLREPGTPTVELCTTTGWGDDGVNDAIADAVDAVLAHAGYTEED